MEGVVEAYCVKCRKKSLMKEAQKVEMKGKGGTTRFAMKGSCESCNTGMYKILGKDAPSV